MSARGGRIAAAALALIAAAAGCTKILGIDYQYEGTSTGAGGGTSSSTKTTTGTGGTSMCGSYVWDAEASCQSCMEKECCSELLACDKGTPCATLAACAAKCMAEDDTCLGACLTTDSNLHQGSGSDAYYALSSCFGVSCEAQANCSFPVCNSGWTWSIRGCAECLSQTSCCAALTTCFSDEVCSDCIAEDTLQGCSANMNYVASNTCVASTCGPLCADTICGSIDFSFASPRCNYCLSKATGGCCAEFNACIADPNSTCYACMSSETETGCDTDMLYAAYSACFDDNCTVDCSGFF